MGSPPCWDANISRVPLEMPPVAFPIKFSTKCLENDSCESKVSLSVVLIACAYPGPPISMDSAYDGLALTRIISKAIDLVIRASINSVLMRTGWRRLYQIAFQAQMRSARLPSTLYQAICLFSLERLNISENAMQSVFSSARRVSPLRGTLLTHELIRELLHGRLHGVAHVLDVA